MKRLPALSLMLCLAGCTMVAPQAPLPTAVLPAGVTGFVVIAPSPELAAAGLALEQAGAIQYRWVSREAAVRTCGGSSACAFPRRNGTCQITIAADLAPDFRDDLIVHERAHCAGWPASHPV